MALDPEVEKLLLNEEGELKNLQNLYEEVAKTHVFKFLSDIGFYLQKVIDYGNKYNIDDDPFTRSMINIILVANYNGVAPLIQLEQGLYISEVYNLEYEHAIKIRSYLELASKVHKGTRLIKTYFKNGKDIVTFKNGADRLITGHSPDETGKQLRKLFDAYKKYRSIHKLEEGMNKIIEHQSEGIRGYGIESLIDSLKDVIPDIKANYNALSTYLHGDFTDHYLNRRISYFMGLKGKQSHTLIKHKELHETLKNVVISDLEYLKVVTQPLADKMDPRG